jgi:hypothetical protein
MIKHRARVATACQDRSGNLPDYRGVCARLFLHSIDIDKDVGKRAGMAGTVDRPWKK